MSALGLVV